MAGSYSHITDSQGRFTGAGLIENGGDAHEALEECYGMIWWLARKIVELTGTPPYPRPELLSIIALARASYRDGLALGLNTDRDDFDPDLEDDDYHGYER